MAIRFFNVNFFAVTKDKKEFLSYRHTIDSKIFDNFLPEIKVTHLKVKETSVHFPERDLNCVFFNGKNKFFYFPWSLCYYVKRQAPQLVFLHGFVFPFQTLLLRLLVSKKTKFIVQHHAEKPYMHPIKLVLQKLAYRNMDAYLFTSKKLAQGYIDQKIIRDSSKIIELMEGSSTFTRIDKKAAKIKLNITSACVFLWVGRLDENKDPLTVLKAFSKLKKHQADFKVFMIYGSTNLHKEVSQFIKQENLVENVDLIGEVPHSNLQDWYSAADYFVSGSHYEGSGISCCEAMSCGCVPIVTEIPSFQSMTNNGKCGYLFKAGNHLQLLEILLSLSVREQLKMEQEVLSQFQQSLSFESIAWKLKELSLQTLNSR